MILFLGGYESGHGLIMHAITCNASEDESDAILKDRLAIRRMAEYETLHGDEDFFIDPGLFIAKKYSYILARDDDEEHKEEAKKLAAMSFTEYEQKYMDSPEYTMTLEEYCAAHPEQFEKPKQGK